MNMMRINLVSDCEEGEVDDEEDDLVAEQDVGHEGDQGKPDWMKLMIVVTTMMRIKMLRRIKHTGHTWSNLSG